MKKLLMGLGLLMVVACDDTSAPADARRDGPPAADGPAAASGCACGGDRTCPVKSIFASGEGVNCCLCLDGGKSCTARGLPPGVMDGDLVGARCTSHSDCPGYDTTVFTPRCIYDIGCESPRGRCALTASFCPANLGATFEYCGCDGRTFTIGSPGAGAFPDRPYRQIGACP
jgi:hypothetical protein